jgi:hypothetical protein
VDARKGDSNSFKFASTISTGDSKKNVDNVYGKTTRTLIFDDEAGDNQSKSTSDYDCSDKCNDATRTLDGDDETM